MRLTVKDKALNDCEMTYAREMYNKLGQLEDIEEELGIDLITLFKALKNGIWIQDLMSLGIQSVSIHYSKEEGIYLYNYFFENCYDFKDYGKTWALTKEELE